MAHDPDVLRGLLERVRAAKGPDPRLDQMLFAQIWGWGFPLHGAAWIDFQALYDRGRITGSVDAALNAVRREMPGAMWAVGCMEGGPFCRLVYPTNAQDRSNLGTGWGDSVSMEQEGGPDTVPLAICAALLTALISQQEAASDV